MIVVMKHLYNTVGSVDAEFLVMVETD